MECWGRGRLVAGAGLWAVRPAYVVVELLVASVARGHDLCDDAVSRLGAVGCTASVCSPGHEVLNATFVVVGALLAVGTVLLAPQLGRLVTALLVAAGLSTALTGLVPVDVAPARHALAATPLFVAQPLALGLLAARVRRAHPRLAGLLATTAVGAGAAGLGFVLLDGAAGTGLAERVALWPVLVALAAAGAVLVRGGPYRTIA
ncbi:DUF998 domain-containing protein [Nocardioides perillae]|uniref:DUF998 domain-containing protein n=1 Tax=Nocardioides perillae TaxID=1119534 RepID=A0A7Y9RVJ4_9ACTN|nr:hypothetical protein [Nocardioides perillae]